MNRSLLDNLFDHLDGQEGPDRIMDEDDLGLGADLRQSVPHRVLTLLAAGDDFGRFRDSVGSHDLIETVLPFVLGNGKNDRLNHGRGL
jgi:hypothetical protein